MMHYILQAALTTTVCFLFYKLLLQRETFFRVNRWFLVACLALSFALPLVPVPRLYAWQGTESYVRQVLAEAGPLAQTRTAPAQPGGQAGSQPPAGETPGVAARPVFEQVLTGLGYLYLFGVLVFGVNLLTQLLLLLYLTRTREAVMDGKFRIVETQGDKAPCSFGNNLFINPEKYDWETYNQILLHEKVHARQKHTADIMLAELVVVLQWFNPFAWLYRKAVEDNLEFLTDELLLRHREVEKQSYQLSLLKVSAPHLPLGVTTNYNQSLIKKRILMMNSKRSSLSTAWKYAFVLPVITLVPLLFNEPYGAVQSQHLSSIALVAGPSNRATPDVVAQVQLAGRWDATVEQGQVCIRFSADSAVSNWNTKHCFRPEEFTGLTAGRASSFELVREAGRIAFEGQLETTGGQGRYRFEASPEFRSYLAGQGFGNVEPGLMLFAFLTNMNQAYFAYLKAEGYPALTPDQFHKFATHMIGTAFLKDYIGAVKAAGYPGISLDELFRAKTHRLGAEGLKTYAAGVKALGYGNATLAELTQLQIHDVNPSYLRAMQQAGYRQVPLDRLVTGRLHGVDPDYIQLLGGLGYNNVPFEALIALKSHQVDAGFIRDANRAAGRQLKVEELVDERSARAGRKGR